MKRVILGFLFIFQVTWVTAQKKSPSIQWITFEQLADSMRRNPKKIFIDIYTDWCVYCKMLDKKTFHNTRIIKDLQENFYSVKFNAEGGKPIRFSGTTYHFQSNGNDTGLHQLVVALYGNTSAINYPSLIFLNEEYQVLYRQAGYVSPKHLEPVLIFFGENKFRTQSWEDFAQNFNQKK